MFNLTNFLINHRITQGADASLSDLGFMQRELDKFLTSSSRGMQLAGERYYEGDHDILRKKRSIKDPKTGRETLLANLPNTKIVDNQYRKAVNQKKNYLLGKPITIFSDNEEYNEILNNIFNARMQRMLKNIYVDALNGGMGWLYFGYGQNGEMTLRKFKPYEIYPFWKDSEHTELDAAIRCYTVTVYNGTKEEKIQKIEIYRQDGIHYYERGERGALVSCEPYHQPYITVSVDDNVEGYNWSRIPLIAFKYNESEMPLIKAVKSLQDGINTIESSFSDNMQEDARNTILVLINYDGENLSEFRQNLATFGAVKVRTEEGGGDVKTLQVEVNAENYKAILKIFKEALIENAMSYDAKDDRLNGQPNRMNILSMYSDIDEDADDTESEFQSALEELKWFIDCFLYNQGKGDFSEVDVKFTFNRNTMVNESEQIQDIKNSLGIVSTRTLLEHHPLVKDVDEELKRLEEEKQVDNMGF